MSYTIFYSKLLKIVSLFFPRNKDEKKIFLLCYIIYIPIGLFLLHYTSIIDHPYRLTDIYYSFDNSIVYHDGSTAFFKHPLMVYMFKPILWIGNNLEVLIPGAKGLLLLLLYNTFASLSVVYVFRYMKDIIQLGNKSCYAIIIFYLTCNTLVYLSFTIESYIFSLWILSFLLWWLSDIYKKEKKLSNVGIIALTTMVGGITITNAAKVILLSYFLKGSWKNKFIYSAICVLISVPMLVVGIINHSKYSDMEASSEMITSNVTLWQTNADNTHGHFLRKASDSFLGSPVFMPQLSVEERVKPARHIENTLIVQQQIVIDFYFSHYLLIPLLLFYLLILYCCYLNRKNIYLWMILAMFSVDFVIHIALRYAINEGFIFSGHWVYILPLIIAWGIKGMKGRLRTILTSVFVVLALFFLVNNVVRFGEFVGLATEYYPADDTNRAVRIINENDTK